MFSLFHQHRRRIQEIGVGITLFEGFNFLYDFVFYPFALAYWGLTTGGIIVTVLSLGINALIFWLYAYMRIDWLGAHALKQLHDKENKNSFEKLVTWIRKKKESVWERLMHPVVFIGLLLPIDPVIVAIHYQEQHFTRLTWRDWGLLILATLVANAWWFLKVGIVIEGVKYLWYLVF